MSRFDRYLLSQLMVLFGFFSLVLVSVYWVNRAVRLFDRLISDGQSAWVFLEFTALTLPSVIRLALPVAAFIATLYVTNRLAGESELVVMQSTGFSPFRMARPVIAFGLVVALLLGILLHVLVPASRTALTARTAEISQNVTTGLLVEGTFLHPTDGVTFYVREITANGELQNIFLSDRRSQSASTTYTAERAFVVRSDRGPKLVMVDGLAQQLEKENGGLSVTRFADFTYDIGALITQTGNAGRDMRELSTPELLAPTQALAEETGKDAAELLFEGHDRIAQTLLTIFFPVIAFAVLLIGGFSRFGLWRQIAAAVFALIVLQFVTNAAIYAGTSGKVGWPAAYLPLPVAALIAFGALALAARPGIWVRLGRSRKGTAA